MTNKGRFITSTKKSMMDGQYIITDTMTGVQYLFARSGYAGGLTILVDKDGKPLVDPNYIYPRN